MRLTDLEAEFLRYEEVPVTVHFDSGDETVLRERYVFVGSLAEAQGIRFQCPKCCQSSGHSVAVSFRDRGVPDHLGSQGNDGKPSRWSVSGSGIDDLTLKPSIDISHACGWHGWVTDGVAA